MQSHHDTPLGNRCLVRKAGIRSSTAKISAFAGSDSSRLPNAAIQSRVFQADPIFVAKNACDASGAQIG